MLMAVDILYLESKTTAIMIASFRTADDIFYSRTKYRNAESAILKSSQDGF